MLRDLSAILGGQADSIECSKVPADQYHEKCEEAATMTRMESIQELSQRIVREFQPDRIILFGSYAYGSPRPDSDVDILVVLSFEGKGFRKSLEILNRLNPPFDVDLLARRPDDISRRYAEGDPLIREALDHGKVLYERYHYTDSRK